MFREVLAACINPRYCKRNLSPQFALEGSYVMAVFASMIPVLDSGGRIRRDVWDDTTAMFVHDGVLMQEATGEPYRYDLSWYEINAKDWRTAEPTSTRLQTSL